MLKIWFLQLISQGAFEENRIMDTDIYKFYEPFIKDIDGSIITKYDTSIEIIYVNCMRSYLADEIKSKSELIQTFKNKVKSKLRDVTVE